MPDSTSQFNSSYNPPADNETRPPLHSLDSGGNARKYRQTSTSHPPGGGHAYLAHLFLGISLTVVAMLFGLVSWRLMHLQSSGRPAAKQQTSSPIRQEKPQKEIVYQVEARQLKTIEDTPDSLFDSKQERQPDDISPKRSVIDVPGRLPEPQTADPIPSRVPEPLTADQIFEQRLQVREDDLLGRLAAVPELRLLDDSMVRNERQAERTSQKNLVETARANQRLNRVSGRSRFARAEIMAQQDQIGYQISQCLHQQMKRAALQAGLGFQSDPKCTLVPETAVEMAQLSKALRDLGFVTVPGVTFASRVTSVDRSINPAAASGSAEPVSGKIKMFQAWCDEHRLEQYPGTLPTLIQMLQVEDESTRLLLIRELMRIKGKSATTQLAERALMDLSPTVRQAAVAELERRPPGEYIPILLRGLRYPWPPVADHAAVALRTLKPSEAAASLVDLLDLPSPSAPIRDAQTNEYTMRELVRLNHLRNCLLCHAPSLNEEDGFVRGLIPTPGSSLPRATGSRGGYYEGAGDFVRADITYLHQDFSVTLLDKGVAPWPREQRYDFVTRLRTVSPGEAANLPALAAEYPQRDAVLYALRGLTGKDGGNSSTRWRELLGLIAAKPNREMDKSGLEKITVSPTNTQRPR